MEKESIYQKLCYYDKRNPNCTMDDEDIADRKKRKPDCSCDNCFYGRTELANTNLELIEAIKLMMICSDFEEAKKKYGDTEQHWTSVVENLIKKIEG